MSERSSNPKSLSNDAAIGVEKINGHTLKSLIGAAITWLKANQQLVNSLNVFPVPDGDTGTNMVLTMQAAEAEINSLDEKNVGKIAHSIAQGALMGARGNSGVILSQIWRGFARALDSLEEMDANLLVRALTEARNTAYKGVVRPVEGTILTVIKDISYEAEKSLLETNDLLIILERITSAAALSVERTPDLLPILKQAGVVDSGGKGLYFLLEGMLRYVTKQPLEISDNFVVPLTTMKIDNNAEIEPGQDYEVVVDFQPKDELQIPIFYRDLSDLGTSIQLGEGDDLFRLHIHVPSEKRYHPIDYIMKLGTVTRVQIENLNLQMEQIAARKENDIKIEPINPGEIAVVAVSPGAGISKIFASLGAAAIVDGGQSMNPSTEQLLKSFEDLPTERVIILPNNKNIILAAQNAISMSVKKVAVIPTRSVPQGINAILRLNQDNEFNEIVSEMNQSLHEVDTGEITRANRDVEMNGVNVKKGEIICLLNGNLVGSANKLEDACLTLFEKAETSEKERITLFYGNELDEKQVKGIVGKISKVYPKHEIEVHEGGQPHYQFIIAIE